MAKLIVEVDDPLSQKPKNKNAPPLMLGTFVRLKIQGKVLNHVAALSETLLHDGKKLWLMSEENKLVIHEVIPVWKEQGLVYFSVDSLPVNARVISSDLSTPVQGMGLRKSTSVIKGQSE